MPHALVVGAGPGLSASVARALAPDHDLTLVARTTDDLADLAAGTGARLVAADASDADAMAAVFADLPADLRVAVYNPSARSRGPITDLDPADVRRALDVTAYGAFLMGRLAARAMLANEGAAKGTILFTGASAGVKGFPRSAPFAMGKFAQRGLAQSMARELHPRGVHVAWINVDGAIGTGEGQLHPDAIARTYRHLVDQDPSAWSEEVAVRPMGETF
ncbi:SDR family NAD(P)-dependent oxidoreductase [Jannaschia sp. Os4]|uniref:SDR family NAD(P)-dependent oxidoreductase n=1 Tax=Jannaschia sp. Os4 TaxID=2807617 RepID=UPI001EED0166|nr:SDR family NAD(P)-dependent oxidoreductase [Jannaschia sp. Os4]